MIQKAEEKDAATVAALAGKLWPHHSEAEMAEEMAALLQKEDAAVFLFYCGEGETAGFAQCGLRRDYVEGTSSSPVGYLEGIYVDEPARGRGAARQLLHACENWARDRGCREFASDCELDNETSRLFHLAAGFEEANRIICFTRKL
jgi:aminoglycoside 6'-N-acetyltransferase I